MHVYDPLGTSAGFALADIAVIELLEILGFSDLSHGSSIAIRVQISLWPLLQPLRCKLFSKFFLSVSAVDLPKFLRVQNRMFIPVWVFGVIAGLMLVVGLVLLFAFIVGTRNARMFRAVAEGASDGLVLMEQDSRIVWVNNAYCKIMGYPRQELIGRYPLSFALPPEDALSEE